MPSKFAGHTPGPWESLIGGVHSEHREILYPLHNTRSGTPEERKANAALIAAAPDLLAACEGMREALRAIRVDSEEWEDRFDGKTAAMSAISDSARAALALADRVLGEEEER